MLTWFALIDSICLSGVHTVIKCSILIVEELFGAVIVGGRCRIVLIICGFKVH